MNKLCKEYMIPSIVERLESIEKVLTNDDMRSNPYHMVRELKLEVKFLNEWLRLLGYVKPVHPLQVSADEVLGEPILTD